MKSQQQLIAKHLQHLPKGKLDWIGIRPGHKQPMLELSVCMANAEQGLAGDHRCSKTPGSSRQVSIISSEFIQCIELHLHNTPIDPKLLRRNLVITGINLNALRYQQFAIGEAVFEATALCHPCSRMEQALGPGAVAAMLGLGGLCCKILNSGLIKLGDSVTVLSRQDHSNSN